MGVNAEIAMLITVQIHPILNWIPVAIPRSSPPSIPPWPPPSGLMIHLAHPTMRHGSPGYECRTPRLVPGLAVGCLSL